MNNLYGQFQSDIQGAANNMMTQLLCAEKGIDYNQLMQQAQQAHVNGILQAEQQRQVNNLIKSHYQGIVVLSFLKLKICLFRNLHRTCSCLWLLCLGCNQ